MFVRSLASKLLKTTPYIFNKSAALLSAAAGVGQRSLSTASIRRQLSYAAFAEPEFVVLKSGDEVQKYPLVWLRDNCQCSECFHRQSTSRIVDWTRFDVNIQPTKVEFNNAASSLNITWSDEHRTSHPLAWLHERQFQPNAQQEYIRNGYRPARQPWSADQFDAIAHQTDFQYSELMNSASGLHDWLLHLSVHGVAIINGAPLDASVCGRLASRVAFIRQTHYGREFHVRNKEGTQNVAYLSTPLQMHTDLPYYDFAPGVNLLHCVEQSNTPQGAFNLLSDGLRVAQLLRDEWPEEWRLLTETEVDWLDVGEDEGVRFETRFRAPVICLDRTGQVQRINHSVPQRDSRFTCPLDQVPAWYRAQAKFVELIYAEAVQFKTRPGDILTFDNSRLVHGRTGYTDMGGNVRHVVGAYLDWDEIYSRLRVLQSDLRRK